MEMYIMALVGVALAIFMFIGYKLFSGPMVPGPK